jgi:hypothetical protein
VGSTRKIGAAFHPEGGIFFAREGAVFIRSYRSAAKSLLFFFRQRCRKNATASSTCEIGSF